MPDGYSRIRNVHRCLLLVIFWLIEFGNYGEFDAVYWVCRCKLLLLFLKLSSVSQGSFNGPFSFLGFRSSNVCRCCSVLEKRRKNDGKSRCRHSEIGFAGVFM